MKKPQTIDMMGRKDAGGDELQDIKNLLMVSITIEWDGQEINHLHTNALIIQ